MVLNLFNNRLSRQFGLFMGHYVEAKALYVARYNRIPCVSFIGELDTSKAFAYINSNFRLRIRGIYQHSYFDHEKQSMYFNNTLFVLNDRRIIELSDQYCQLLHTRHQYAFATQLIHKMAEFRKSPEPVQKNRIVGFTTDSAEN